ncbi:MAG: serine hydrolase, partial [Amphiplicatus sp.]
MGRRTKLLGLVPALMLVFNGCDRDRAGLTTLPSDPENRAALSADIAALAEPLCADTVSIGVYRSGEILEQISWRRDGGAVSPDAQFELGSLTKHLTAIAILKLQEEGEISIEDPISAHVDGLP